MSNNYMVSIITVVYNGEDFLEASIQSVINQTYENIEYIIIDGGSTDNTTKLIKRYKDKVDYWVSEKDSGVYDAMNKGIDASNGDFLFFLGADDLLADNILGKIFNDLKNKYVLVYGNVQYNTGSFVKSKFSYKTYLHNTIHHQAAFYDKNLFKNFRYDKKYKISADYELNLIIFLKYKQNTLYMNNTFSICGDGGISINHANKSHLEMCSIRKKYFPIFINSILNIFLKLKIYLKRTFKA
jgi:putative colanic acid biosynthesis glycosyltransferase